MVCQSETIQLLQEILNKLGPPQAETARYATQQLVMSRGNPWVQQAIPLPLPPKTPTPHQGYGFLKGLNIHTLTSTPHTLD